MEWASRLGGTLNSSRMRKAVSRSESGSALDEKERARIARTIELLETNGLRLGAPHTKHIQRKIWELRISSGRRDCRVFYYAATGRQFVLLHAFLKKTPKTPKRELEIAERRLIESQQ